MRKKMKMARMEEENRRSRDKDLARIRCTRSIAQISLV